MLLTSYLTVKLEHQDKARRQAESVDMDLYRVQPPVRIVLLVVYYNVNKACDVVA